jgi:hypothetical protein
MWMRRWKTAHFSDPATAAAATTSSGAASDPSERAWQKRFRASEKEKLGLQEEIDELRRRLENSTHELAVTYEIIQDLQPDHDHTGAGEQSAAARHQSDDLLKKAQEEAQAANRRRFGSLIDVKKGLHNWKDKVLDRLKKKQSTKSLHDLAVFKRQDVITNNMETQTDLVGPVKADDSKEHLDPKKKTKTKPKRLGEVAGKESAKIPKMSIKQAVQIIADVLSKACTQHETNQRTGREGVSFPEFVRDCLIRQFGIKSLALKTLKSLCATSRSGHESDNMLALFNELAAIEGPGPSKYVRPHASERKKELAAAARQRQTPTSVRAKPGGLGHQQPPSFAPASLARRANDRRQRAREQNGREGRARSPTTSFFCARFARAARQQPRERNRAGRAG